MKANKLFKKLALSGVALGAAAVTLTATTYAWYTANTTVEIEKITGMTEAKTGAADIFVSAASTYSAAGVAQLFGEWGNKVTPTAASETSLTGSNVPTHNLRPVTYIDGTSTAVFKPLTGTSKADESDLKDNVAVYGNYDNNHVFRYTLRFHVASSETSNLYFSDFSLSTGYQTTHAAIIASTFGPGTGITAKGAYEADLSKALKLTVSYTVLDGSDATGGQELATPVKGSATYDLTTVAASTISDSHIGVDSGTDPNPANAVGYYNKVMGTDISAPSSYDSSFVAITKGSANDTDAVAFATIPGTNEYVEVTFTFWLDGWDSYCYDCMKQQKFEFSFKADTDAKKSVIHSA